MSKKTNFNIFFIAFAALLVLVFVFYAWMAPIKNFVFSAASPLMNISEKSGAKLASAVNFLFTLKDLSVANSRLQRENQDLRNQVSSLFEASRENEFLRTRLNLGQASQSKAVLANVIGYNNQLGQYILINKGQNDGLAQDMAVVDANNFLIGKITEAGSGWAKVTLISDSNSLVNALTQDSRIEGMVKGSHGIGISMEMVPIDQKINNGEAVLTSGLNDSIPKGLVIGHISEVILKENDIFQSAKIQPAAGLKQIENVFVITSK